MPYVPDLDAYFARIGYDGPRVPTLATLAAISRAHVQAIPFENLDVLLGRGIDLAPEAIEAKLVHARRGGYCFEQNGLLLAVLDALGFAVRPLGARVRLQRPRDFTPPRTHLFARVELDGESWLADVGVGALSLTSPIRLDVDGEQATAHEPRRILREGGRLYHQARLGPGPDDWVDVCEFTLDDMPMIDRIVANWYTSTHPQSHFRGRLMAARASATGRVTLADRELTLREPSGTTRREVGDADELLAVLAEHFGLRFPSGTRFTVT